MEDYKKVYKKHYGEIPDDQTGRKYEIHHIDGNHKNNAPENLTAVTLQEHYNIHYSQGDWGACLLMSERMKLSPEEKSELGRKHSLERLTSRTHPWMTRDDGTSNSSDRVSDGTHNLLRRPDGTSHMSERVKNGTHPGRARLLEGTHNFITSNPTKKTWYCSHCDRNIGGKSNYNRWHGDNCKLKRAVNE